MPPKVFLSHASDDKPRFVQQFATRLRGSGVDVWLDTWEMLPGDSLIDKIFKEGLKNADVFLIVLSINSINSDWVRKELNTAHVKQIEGECRILPVVLDDVKIPESLRETIYQSIKDTNSYDDEYSRILNSIFGYNEKPPLGAPPAYVKEHLTVPSGLTQIDYFLLKRVFEYCSENEFLIPHTEPLMEEALAQGWALSESEESFISLVEQGYLQGVSTLNRRRGPAAVRPTLTGWALMFQDTRSDYTSTLIKLAFHLANIANGYEGKNGVDLMNYLGESRLFTFHLLDVLEAKGFIKLTKTMGPSYYVVYISPQLKRALQNGQF